MVKRYHVSGETHLLLAEARIRQNNASGAAEAINVVRKRAGAPDITASQATMDFLLDERIRELFGEELCRFPRQSSTPIQELISHRTLVINL